MPCERLIAKNGASWRLDNQDSAILRRLLIFFCNNIEFNNEKIHLTKYKEDLPMVKLNMGLKSALLSLVVISAMPVATTHTQEMPSVVSNAVMSFVKDHKVAFVGAAAWFIIDTRLRTRTKATFSMDDLKQDFADLLTSLNVFDAQLYKQLVFLFDKYIIGLPIKIKDSTIRTQNADGSIVAVKDNKLVQKPFGVYGLVDAYVLSQVKKFTTETVAAGALIYAYLKFPKLMFAGAEATAQKTLNVTVTVNNAGNDRNDRNDRAAGTPVIAATGNK
jgi:hypothetical protein